MKLHVVRILLWLIRKLGFTADSPGGPGTYQWVRSPGGSFDHWFYTPERTYSVCWVCQAFGFWPVIRGILFDSELLINWRRWVYNEVIKIRSEQYFCGPPLRDEFAAHALAQFIAADPKGDVLAQTAAAYRIANAMMDARLKVDIADGTSRSIRHPNGCNYGLMRDAIQIRLKPSVHRRPLFRFSGDSMKQTIDGFRQLLSLWFLDLALAVLPADHKEDLAKHIGPYLQEVISKDTV